MIPDFNPYGLDRNRFETYEDFEKRKEEDARRREISQRYNEGGCGPGWTADCDARPAPIELNQPMAHARLIGKSVVLVQPEDIII